MIPWKAWRQAVQFVSGHHFLQLAFVIETARPERTARARRRPGWRRSCQTLVMRRSTRSTFPYRPAGLRQRGMVGWSRITGAWELVSPSGLRSMTAVYPVEGRGESRRATPIPARWILDQTHHLPRREPRPAGDMRSFGIDLSKMEAQARQNVGHDYAARPRAVLDARRLNVQCKFARKLLPHFTNCTGLCAHAFHGIIAGDHQR